MSGMQWTVRALVALGVAASGTSCASPPPAQPIAPPPWQPMAPPPAQPMAATPPVDTSIGALVNHCVNAGLDDRRRSELVRLLAQTRDPRAEPCFIKVLRDYRMDATEEDVRWAARAIRVLKPKGAAEPLFEVFLKLRASRPGGTMIYRDVHDALVELPEPAWEGQLIALVNRPIDDRKDFAALKDEMFWQITAAELLAILKSTHGVKPLIRAILTPNKVELGNTALNALIRIGKPSIGPAMALLKNEDRELAEYSKFEMLKAAPPGPDGKAPASAQREAETAHIGTASAILAAIGREEATTPLIEAAAKANEMTRVLIARDFVNLPASPALVKAFRSTYEKTPLSLTAPLIGSAREALLDRAPYFFDPSLTPWIVKTAMQAKGDPEDVDAIRVASLASAMKIMTHDQVPLVDTLHDSKSTDLEGHPSFTGKSVAKEYKLCKDLLAACTDNVGCYLGRLAEPDAHASDTVMTGIKAISMIGILGTPEVKAKLIELMPRLTNGDVRGITGVVLDRLFPRGDPTLAAALQKLVDDAEASKEPGRKQTNASFKQVIYRLNARAQQ